VLRYRPATLVPGLACVLAVLGGAGGWSLVRRRQTREAARAVGVH
jgi:hypothetical protein